MIVLLSGDGDVSTDYVCECLLSLKYPFVRINSYDLLDKEFGMSVSNGGFTLRVGDRSVSVDDIGAVWYRKFGFFYKSKQYKSLSGTFNTTFANNISKEFTSVLEAVVSVFREKNWVTDPSSIGLNKIEVLNVAKRMGLDIPRSYVINSKDCLIEICADKESISKSIRDPWVISNNLNFTTTAHTMFTSVLHSEDLQNIPDRFFPSLIQEKIEKKFEIRSFYLDGRFYSMAMFSQLDPQTTVDFRKYNWSKPNRCVPYAIPSHIESKLKRLVGHFNLNCCSIDIIKGKDGRFYFLEINPTGQFGMVDFPCNYDLHHKVARFLITIDQKFHKKKKVLRKD